MIRTNLFPIFMPPQPINKRNRLKSGFISRHAVVQCNSNEMATKTNVESLAPLDPAEFFYLCNTIFYFRTHEHMSSSSCSTRKSRTLNRCRRLWWWVSSVNCHESMSISAVVLFAEICKSFEAAGKCDTCWHSNGRWDLLHGPFDTQHSREVSRGAWKTAGGVGSHAAYRRCLLWSCELFSKVYPSICSQTIVFYSFQIRKY